MRFLLFVILLGLGSPSWAIDFTNATQFSYFKRKVLHERREEWNAYFEPHCPSGGRGTDYLSKLFDITGNGGGPPSKVDYQKQPWAPVYLTLFHHADFRQDKCLKAAYEAYARLLVPEFLALNPPDIQLEELANLWVQAPIAPALQEAVLTHALSHCANAKSYQLFLSRFIRTFARKKTLQGARVGELFFDYIARFPNEATRGTPSADLIYADIQRDVVDMNAGKAMMDAVDEGLADKFLMADANDGLFAALLLLTDEVRRKEAPLRELSASVLKRLEVIAFLRISGAENLSPLKSLPEWKRLETKAAKFSTAAVGDEKARLSCAHWVASVQAKRAERLSSDDFMTFLPTTD